MRLSILENGSRETLKGAIHGVTLSLAALIAAYNAAAWLQRRQRHLAVNAVVYTALVFFERQHVRHHRASRQSRAAAALLAAAAVAASTEDSIVEKKAA